MKRDQNADRKRLKADPRGRRSERSRLRRAAIRGAPVLAAALTLIAAGCGGEEPVAGKPAGTVSPESVTAPAVPTDAPPTATTATTAAAAVTTTLIATTITTAVAEAASVNGTTAAASSPAPASQPAAPSPPAAEQPAAPSAPRPEASTLEGILALERPLVIAHAGGDQDHPHSTLYAYAQSAAAGADVLELDVQLTADNVLIVQHDDTVDRTTEATGPVVERTLAEIQTLDNAHWFAPGRWGDRSLPAEQYVFRGVRTGEIAPPSGFDAEDFRVATFREVAERFPHHVLNVEIKLQRGPDGEADPGSGIAAARVLAAEIAELGREDSVIVACFDDEVLAAFQRLAPGVAASPGTDELLAWWLAGTELPRHYRVLQVPLTYGGVEVVQPDLVDRMHDEGRQVWVWLSGTDVLESRELYADLLGRSIDGIIAGRPAEAVEAMTALAGTP